MGLIGSIIGTVGSFIAGCVSKIGPAIGSFAKNVVGIVSKIPGIGALVNVSQTIDFIAKVVHAVVDILDIQSEDAPEVLGVKAEQAEKTIEDFDGDAEAYIRYLKEEVELDKAKMEDMTPEEKLGCKAVGLSLETKAVEKKLEGVEITPESLALLGKIHMAGVSDIDADQLLRVIRELKAAGITNMNDVVDYLEGKGDSNRMKTGEALRGAIGEAADEKIDLLKDAVRSFEGE